MDTPIPHHDDKSAPILDAIAKGEVRMRSRWLFTLEHAALGVAIVLVAVGLVYLGSFVGFLWRAARFSALPAFGPAGYGVFLQMFPWWQLGFVLVGAAAFIFLLRRSTHLYRWPLAVTVGVFAFAFITAAALTDTTRLHDRLANRSLRGMAVPILGPLYHGHGRLVRGLVTPGAIMRMNGNTWTVKLEEGTVRVTITDETRIPANWEPEKGDEIVIIGERDDGTIEAVSIMPADRLPMRRPFHMRLPDETPVPPPSYY